MIGFWILFGGIALYIIGSFLEWLAGLTNGSSKHMALLYLLAIPLALLLLPFKLASDMMGGGKRRRR